MSRSCFSQFGPHRFGWFVVGDIVKLYRPVALLEEVVGVQRGVAGTADELHLCPAFFAVAQQRTHHIRGIAHVGFLRPQVPVQAFGDVVGGAQFADAAHVAGGAGRCPVIARFPGIGRAVPDPVFAVGQVDVAMFAVFVDLDVWMVRTEVAGGAGVGAAGFSDAEFVAGVAGGAVAGAAVGVDAAHAHVGPGVREGAVVLAQLDLGAVALHTTCFISGVAEFRVALPFVLVAPKRANCLWE